MKSVRIGALVLVVLVAALVGAGDALTSAITDRQMNSFVVYFDDVTTAPPPVSRAPEYEHFIFLPLTAHFPMARTVQWNFAPVDCMYTAVDDEIGLSSMMALDSVGAPHIVYDAHSSTGNNVLRYARLTGSQWMIEDIGDTALGAGVALALSNDDVPHISYSVCNPYDCTPKYAEWANEGWAITEEMSGHGALAVDSGGSPHLSYVDGNMVGQMTLRYAHRSEGTWITTTIVNEADSYRTPTLKLDASEFPHITYNEYELSDAPFTTYDISGNLQYARWDGSTWIVDVIDDDIVDETAQSYQIGQNSALALGTNGYVHISYYDWDERRLKYALWSGSNWIVETVGTVQEVSGNWTTQYVAIALDTEGRPHLVYFDQGAVKYAYRSADQWVVETLATKVGEYSELSIAVDAQNRLHVTYDRYDGQKITLMYGRGVFQ